MPKSVRAFRHGDPFLKPHWRWLRAETVSKNPGQRTDDALVNAACDYLEHGHAGKHHVLLEAALRLREPHRAEQADELKARVLSGQPLCEVARCCGLTEEVVAAFCDWFFDVRNRLTNHDWVSCQVLASREADDSASSRLHGLWYRIGYFGGTLALEPLLAVSKGLPIPAEFLTARGSARQEQEFCLRSQITLFIAIALATTPDDWQNVAKMHADLRQRFPATVSEIPDAHWMVLGGVKARSKKTKKPSSQATTSEEMATSSSTGSPISSAVLATLLF